MFGLHGDAVWVEKRDSDRAIDRGIMRNAREGSELRAGQTPYTWLFTARHTGAIFPKHGFMCLLISLTLRSVSCRNDFIRNTSAFVQEEVRERQIQIPSCVYFWMSVKWLHVLHQCEDKIKSFLLSVGSAILHVSSLIIWYLCVYLNQTHTAKTYSFLCSVLLFCTLIITV